MNLDNRVSSIAQIEVKRSWFEMSHESRQPSFVHRSFSTDAPPNQRKRKNQHDLGWIDMTDSSAYSTFRDRSILTDILGRIVVRPEFSVKDKQFDDEVKDVSMLTWKRGSSLSLSSSSRHVFRIRWVNAMRAMEKPRGRQSEEMSDIDVRSFSLDEKRTSRWSSSKKSFNARRWTRPNNGSFISQLLTRRLNVGRRFWREKWIPFIREWLTASSMIFNGSIIRSLINVARRCLSRSVPSIWKSPRSIWYRRSRKRRSSKTRRHEIKTRFSK